MEFVFFKIFKVIKLPLFNFVSANQGSAATATTAWPLGVIVNVKLTRP